MKKIQIFDTTLRDGEQGKGINFTVNDKIKITKLLDELGIDFIEAGWPGSNPKTVEYFKEIKNHEIKNSKIVAFGSTRHPKNSVKNDVSLNAIIATKVKYAAIFGKSWDLHVNEALRIPLKENLKVIFESINYLKQNGLYVCFDAEHFFDGYKNNEDYALEVISTACEAGADLIALCDTNGGALTSDISESIRKVKEITKCDLGIHAHNDIGLGIANSLVGIEEGAIQIQGTINGMGERCGNANLTTIIPLLSLKSGYKTIPFKSLKNLTHFANHINEIANLVPDENQPFVGRNAFTHKAGIHVSAILKNSKTYEHIDPEKVGNKREVIVSELSGKSNLVFKAKEFGIDIEKNDKRLTTLIKRIKDLENKGYSFEDADVSFELMLRRELGSKPEFFKLEGFRVLDTKRSTIENVIVEATVILEADGKRRHTASVGNGPVNALDQALRLALMESYPSLSKLKLTDYKVRVIDSNKATSAIVRVFIESSDGEESWGTVGVSTNIIEASWQAIVDSVDYFLMKESK